MKQYKNQQYFTTYESNFTLDTVIRAIVDEVLALAEQTTGKKSTDMVVLDVGSGFGGYSFALEKRVRKVVGVEPDTHAYRAALKEAKRRGSKVQLHNALIENFSTRDRFDPVLSLTTLEHMPDQEASYRRVLSLMAPHGMMYLTAPNKWWIVEPHYALPFLSWLPVKVANVYVRLTGKAASFEDSAYSRSYFGMKRLFNKLPCSYSFYVPSPEASYLGCGQQKTSIYKSVRDLGIGLIRRFPLFWSISKGFILIVKKR